MAVLLSDFMEWDQTDASIQPFHKTFTLRNAESGNFCNIIFQDPGDILFSNFFHQIHQKGRDFKLIRSGLIVAFLALTRGQCRDSAKVLR